MRLPALLAVCMALTGCGQASAAAIDPRDDIHCSVLAFYFHGFAQHHGMPAAQIKAAQAVHDWYAARMRAVAGERWSDMASFEKETAPVLETIKADPLAMRDEFAACTQRAAADPAFNKHARAYR